MFPRVPSSEAWRDLKPGDRVKVTYPVSAMERDLLGREFTIVRFSNPHGYAVCGEDSVVAGDEYGNWHLHPEALVRI